MLLCPLQSAIAGCTVWVDCCGSSVYCISSYARNNTPTLTSFCLRSPLRSPSCPSISGCQNIDDDNDGNLNSKFIPGYVCRSALLIIRFSTKNPSHRRSSMRSFIGEKVQVSLPSSSSRNFAMMMMGPFSHLHLHLPSPPKIITIAAARVFNPAAFIAPTSSHPLILNMTTASLYISPPPSRLQLHATSGFSKTCSPFDFRAFLPPWPLPPSPPPHLLRSHRPSGVVYSTALRLKHLATVTRPRITSCSAFGPSRVLPTASPSPRPLAAACCSNL